MDSRIQTYSGVMFDPLNPDPDLIRIEDIAVALSHLCRYTGHVKRFYSVAEHSVWVSRLVSRKAALWGLLHDASEAYLGDVARPLKQTAFYADYRKAEARLMWAVCIRFGLPIREPAEVRKIDHAMLWHEIKAFKHPKDQVWKERNYPWKKLPSLKLVGYDSEAAFVSFMARYDELTNP